MTVLPSIVRQEAISKIRVDRSEVQGVDAFPLNLAPVEAFWFWDDSAEYPKRFRIAMEWVGQIDRAIWNESLKGAICRHPMLLARLNCGSQKKAQDQPIDTRCTWVIPEVQTIDLRWREGDFQNSPFPTEWDLRSECGVRFWSSESPAMDREGISTSDCRFVTVMECHHAVTDGMGIRQFIADWMILYDEAFGSTNRDYKLFKLDAKVLEKRGVVRRPAKTLETRRTTIWERIGLAIKFHSMRLAKLAGTSHPHNHVDQPREANHYRFSTLRYKNRDQESSAPQDVIKSSLNEYAIFALAQTIDRWNRETRPNSSRRSIRIMLPTDLRTLDEKRMPAANRLGFGFAVVTIRDLDRSPPNLSLIATEVAAIRKLQLGWDFVEVFTLLTRVPRIAARLIRSSGSFASGVITNLGDTTRRHRRRVLSDGDQPRCGHLTLRYVVAVPPLRPGTEIGVGLCRCADTLAIGIIVNSSKFSSNDADRLAKMYSEAFEAISNASALKPAEASTSDIREFQGDL